MCDLCKQSALLFLRSAVEVSLLISSRTFCGPGRRSTESISPKKKPKKKRKQKQKKKMKMLQMFAGCLAADRASSSLSYLFSLRQKRFLSPCSRGRCDAFAGQAVAQEKKAFKGGTVFPAQRASSCVARRLRTSRGDKIWLIDGPLHPYCASIRATGAGRKRRRRSNSRD